MIHVGIEHFHEGSPLGRSRLLSGLSRYLSRSFVTHKSSFYVTGSPPDSSATVKRRSCRMSTWYGGTHDITCCAASTGNARSRGCTWREVRGCISRDTRTSVIHTRNQFNAANEHHPRLGRQVGWNSTGLDNSVVRRARAHRPTSNRTATSSRTV